MHQARRKQLNRMSLVELRILHRQLGELISELESRPPREIDIATGYGGERHMVARVVDVIGDPEANSWQKVLQIYCSSERCCNCPHGDFIYRFRRRRRDGSITVRFQGKRVFSEDTLARIKRQAKAPVAVYTLELRDLPPNSGCT